MEETCKACGSSERVLFCRGVCRPCYYKVNRMEKRQRDILQEAKLVADEVAETYGVELDWRQIGDPFGMTPVVWTLACVDEAIRVRMGSIPEDDLFLQLNAFGGKSGGTQEEA